MSKETNSHTRVFIIISSSSSEQKKAHIHLSGWNGCKVSKWITVCWFLHKLKNLIIVILLNNAPACENLQILCKCLPITKWSIFNKYVISTDKLFLIFQFCTICPFLCKSRRVFFGNSIFIPLFKCRLASPGLKTLLPRWRIRWRAMWIRLCRTIPLCPMPDLRSKRAFPRWYPLWNPHPLPWESKLRITWLRRQVHRFRCQFEAVKFGIL